MAATSESGKLAEAVAAWLAGAYAWDTAPAAAWMVDFDDRADLQAGGLAALVIPPEYPFTLQTRGVTRGRAVLTVSVFKPAGSGATFADGDAVVDRAEKIMAAMLGRAESVVTGQTRRCVEVEAVPLISKDALRQYRLWLSFIRSDWA